MDTAASTRSFTAHSPVDRRARRVSSFRALLSSVRCAPQRIVELCRDGEWA